MRWRWPCRSGTRGTRLADALAGLRCPVGGIWGSRDAPAMPDVAAREAALRAIQPGLRFVTIEGAGHWVAFEAAAEFNAALDGFLAAWEAAEG